MNDESFFPPPQVKPAKKLNYSERVKAGLQRGGLNPLSRKRQEKLKEYSKAFEDDAEIQYCACCGHKGTKESLSRHHYKGRKFITDYIYLCQGTGCRKHDLIHENPNKAMEEGWIWPEIRGLQPNPNQLIPWIA